MPTPYIRKIANEKGISVTEVEHIWEKAKSSVKKSKYPKNYYAMVTAVFKEMIGESIVTFKDFLILKSYA